MVTTNNAQAVGDSTLNVNPFKGDMLVVLYASLVAITMGGGALKLKNMMKLPEGKVMGVPVNWFIFVFSLIMFLVVVIFAGMGITYAEKTAGDVAKDEGKCTLVGAGGATAKAACAKFGSEDPCNSVSGCTWKGSEAWVWWFPIPYLITLILWFFLLSVVLFSSLKHDINEEDNTPKMIAWFGIILMILQTMSKNYIIKKCKDKGVNDRYIRYLDTLFWPLIFMLIIAAIVFIIIQAQIPWKTRSSSRNWTAAGSFLSFGVIMALGVFQFRERGGMGDRTNRKNISS